MKRAAARPSKSVDRTEVARRALLKRRADLLRRRQSMINEGEELVAAVEPDWEDTAANVTAADALDHLSDFELNQLQRISGALQRIEAGTFGRCVSCGEPIEEARLKAMPEAPTCILCSN